MDKTLDMNKIDVDNKHFYEYDKPENRDRTKKRLQELVDMGCEETGIASFGVKGVVSGLFIERVWSYSDERWTDYIEWMKSVINEKTEKLS